MTGREGTLKRTPIRTKVVLIEHHQLPNSKPNSFEEMNFEGRFLLAEC
jgi:hypothetical protein